MAEVPLTLTVRPNDKTRTPEEINLIDPDKKALTDPSGKTPGCDFWGRMRLKFLT